LLILLVANFHTFGQQEYKYMNFLHSESDSVYIDIKSTSGEDYSGLIISEDSTYLVIEPEWLVRIKMPKYKIESYHLIDRKQIVNGEYMFENPHATRYFYGPNGYGLKKGEGYYQNTWVLFNQVSVGFSDYFSVGTGMIPAFLFGGTPTPVWITPKVSIPVQKDKVNLGAGVLAATVLGESGTSFGIAYGTFTYGSKDHNFSGGIGWAYSDAGLGDKPTLMFSGITRVGKKGYLLTENYFITTAWENIGIISVGGRTVQKKLAVDYGLFMPLNIGATIAFPWLSITIPFGN